MEEMEIERSQFKIMAFDELRTCFECDGVIPAGTSAFLIDGETYCAICVETTVQEILEEDQWPEEIDS